jgi:gliding motility-associated lipoprotein GldH
MRFSWLIISGAILFSSCDETRLYEKNHDFKGRQWLVTEKPTFDFLINDTSTRYNLICNFRNSLAYPYTRIFITYTLSDSTGSILLNEMITSDLFNRKTGEPIGSSALGDLYDQQFLLKEDFQFTNSGKYSIRYEQFMRTDTLQGALAVGLRVEKNLKK